MKQSKVILILIMILLAHGLVLVLVLGNGCAGKEEQIAEQKKFEKSETVFKKEPEAPKIDSVVKRRQDALAKIKLPYDYTNSVVNTIPGFRKGKPGTAGIIVDLETRKVLWCKNVRKSVPIASMTKLMTMLVAYEMTLDPASGITLKTPVKVSVAAYKIGGSQVYLDPKETFTVEELLMAAAVKSANDAAYLLAEFFGNGDVASFVKRMNTKAAELGMKHTVFRNPHGLPGKTSAEDNVSSPEDMVRLAEATLLHPQLMKWTSTWKAPFRQPGDKGYMMMQNSNHLVPGGSDSAAGVDGLKTGFIARSGYCLAASCKRGDRRVIAVVMGHPTWRDRDRFVKALLDWGYARIAR